jgi:hypothetical protein
MERCLIELQLTLVLVGGIFAVLSSKKYGQTKFLRKMKKAIRSNCSDIKNRFLNWLNE